jgi:2-methylisocitrate lyase-like PEP mutase family enzyme
MTSCTSIPASFRCQVPSSSEAGDITNRAPSLEFARLSGVLEEKCDLLRSLHVPGRPLVLPNGWDVPSARAIVAAGFRVVATTSGGVAETLGYEDEHRAPPEEMFAAAARIARSVDVPVTVDAEGGYGLAPAEVVDALFRAGAAGCNLEDTDHSAGRLKDPALHAEWLADVRSSASDRGYRLVVNARVDVFLADRTRSQGDLVGEAIDRARAYREAGADCIYPIFLREESFIASFVEAVDAPVNILALPQAPSPSRLAELGVARVSYGSAIHRRVMDSLATLLADLGT